MNKKLVIIFLLIVLAPLAAILALGYRLMRGEQEMVEHRYRALTEQRLRDVDGQIARLLARRAGELSDLLSKTSPDKTAMRDLVQKNSMVSNAFAIGVDGQVLYPDVRNTMNNAEQEFIYKTAGLWESRQLEYGAPEEQARAQASQQMQQMAQAAAQQTAQALAQPIAQAQQMPSFVSLNNVVPLGERRQVGVSGWFPWFTGDGISLLYYTVQPSLVIVGAELSRSRLVADVIGMLPSTSSSRPDPPDARIVLRDSHNAVLYQWGGYRPTEKQKPNAAFQLSFPLSAWRLEYFDSEAAGAPLGRSVVYTATVSATALALVLAGLATYFYRENTRQLREAEQRVSFVNQVSHELKTPLTNIRMYAEMLDGKLAGEEEGERRNLRVIVSESQRLSRLIANVLTFGRSSRSTLKLNMRTGSPEEILAGVVETFRPALIARKIDVEFSGGTQGECLFDPDALEQIVGNLLSNVEKYAGEGSRVKIGSEMQQKTLQVRVEDNGPGIPPPLRKRVFEPFFRGSDSLTEGVSGTGIGLTIARELARLHGGDLVLLPGDKGAAFEITIRTEQV